MTSPSRPQRYPLVMRVTYRQTGTAAWLEGRTINVSPTGVLFTTLHRLLPADARVELSLRMSELGSHIGDVACRGRVVRGVTSDGSGREMAIAFEGYRFLRQAGDRPANST